MKIAAPVVALLLIACDGRQPLTQKPSDDGRIAEVRQRLAAVETDLLAAQKQLIASQQTTEDLRRRLATVEARFSISESEPTLDAGQSAALMALTPATNSTPSNTTPATATNRASSVPMPVVPPPARTGPRVLVVGAPSSSGITSDSSIIRQCASKWGTDYRMVAYCQKEQEEAKAKLAAGDTRHVGSAFSSIRLQCQQKWGDDYRMRVYCENEQIDAYKAVNGQQ